MIKPDQTYQVFIDMEERSSGSLIDDLAILPPAKIPDPDATKPADWVDNKTMDDPEDIKPEDYDAPEYVIDEDAEKPEDWDDEMDGEWERPQVPNPLYKGEWKPKVCLTFF